MPHVTEEIWSYLPARQTRLIVAPWPVAGDAADAGALDNVKAAAERFRRSGVLPSLDGDEERIFNAVVKPERAAAARRRRRGASGHGCVARSARAEAMLANERFVANAPAAVVEAEREKLERYRRELDAIGD